MGKNVSRLVSEKIIAKIVDDGMAIGTQLPSERELALLFGVTQVTVRTAMEGLVGAGVIEKRPRVGSFLLKRPEVADSRIESKIVAMVIRSEGHFFADMCSALNNRLKSSGFVTFVLPSLLNAKPREIANYLQQLDAMECQNLLIEGYPDYWIPEMARRLRIQTDMKSNWRKVIWLHGVAPPPSSIIGNAIHFDYGPLMSRMISELKELGHRRIAYVTHQISPDLPFQEYHSIRTEKYASAMLKSGLESNIEVFSMDGVDNEPHMTRLGSRLVEPSRPTAFICSYDFLAVRIIRLAKSLGLEVPRDFSIIGAMDTPWAEAYGLATVRLDHDGMAKQVVDMLTRSESNSGNGTIHMTFINNESVGKVP